MIWLVLKQNLERKNSKENYAKEVIYQKFSQLDEFTKCIVDSWGKIKQILLEILNNDIGNMEIAPRKPWITENHQQNGYKEEKQKTRNTKEYRKLNNQLRWETQGQIHLYGRDK